MGFARFPEEPVTLKDVTVPACFLGQAGGLVRTDISVAEGQIRKERFFEMEMEGAMLFPAFTDMHTHLDKGHIWRRTPNPDGTFEGALLAVGEDREARWSSEDVAARMDFALRCAYAHGTRAVRTHLDSIPPQDDTSWEIFGLVREEWADRIALQAVCLIGCEGFSEDGPFRHTADLVEEHRGVLGMVTYPVPDLKDRLRGFYRMAAERGLSADFHCDETMDPGTETLRLIAEAKIETGFDAPVVVGHCCSLSTQDEARALDTLDLVAKAGIHVVSLPMCNLYLQDRHTGRTPRGRGITLVHEMKARGIPVSFASDNTRDPFYAYGDLDMIEVMREATKIGHLDHSDDDWPLAFSQTPAETCGFDTPSLAPGAPADFVICRARDWSELFSRPQTDRIVIRNGIPIDTTLPDYRELDIILDR